MCVCVCVCAFVSMCVCAFVCVYWRLVFNSSILGPVLYMKNSVYLAIKFDRIQEHNLY